MRLAEIKKRGQAIGFRGFALQLIDLQLERVVFAVQPLIFP